MQRTINMLVSVFLCLLSLLLVYFSFATFDTLAKIQNLVNNLNQTSDAQLLSVNSGIDGGRLAEFENLHDKLSWDADTGAMLITVINNSARANASQGRQHALIAKAQNYYQHSLSLRPRDIQLLSGQLDLLIDQGAPADYILPKLDKLITFVPKDQDLKSELAMLCFKLMSLNPSADEQVRITNSLQSLFDYTMDYRGLIYVRRYAKLYGQEDVLKDVLSKLN